MATKVSSESVENERFRRLYEEVYDDIWQYCQRRSFSDEQAVDVLSDTMLVMWERIDDVPVGEGARPWLFGVARNQLRKRNESSSRSDRLVERLKQEFSARSPTAGPAEEAEAHLILDTLSRLPEDDRELLRLQAWEGLSQKEIGLMFDVTENAIAIRIHRARQKLAVLLSESQES